MNSANQVLCSLLLLCSCANFHIVEEGRFYRSGQMSAEALRETIEEYDIQTVIRLRGAHGPSFPLTYQPVVEMGIDFVSLPLKAHRYPTKRELLALWEVFQSVDYPILVHCRAGADRTSMASAIYVLQTTDDFDLAMGQMAFLPYFHLGWFSADCMDEMFAMYEPFHGRLAFPDWVRSEYHYPGMEEAEPPLEETQNAAPVPDRELSPSDNRK